MPYLNVLHRKPLSMHCTVGSRPAVMRNMFQSNHSSEMLGLLLSHDFWHKSHQNMRLAPTLEVDMRRTSYFLCPGLLSVLYHAASSNPVTVPVLSHSLHMLGVTKVPDLGTVCAESPHACF